MRRVMIGTPCYDGRLDVWYVNSLVGTLKLAKEKNIEVIPIWVSFDALIQRARNDTVHIAIEGDYDDLIWIDSDIEWEPEWFFKLLEYPQDVIGGTYRKKGDKEEYVLRKSTQSPVKIPENGIIEVSGLGTGFVKMSKKALKYLWDTSAVYIDPKDNKERRMIFDVIIRNKDMISEDISMFFKLIEGGFRVWLDTNMTCNHIGPYKFKGNIVPWYNNGCIVPDISGPPAIVTKHSNQIETTKPVQDSKFKIPIFSKKQL